MMREISFKKQMANQWRRKDSDGASHVTPDAMHREIQKLVNDGWRIVCDNGRMIILHSRRESVRSDISYDWPTS